MIHFMVILIILEVKGKSSVMVNFMCQLDWAMGCPDIWSNVILSVSVGVYLDETNIETGRLSKADCPP